MENIWSGPFIYQFSQIHDGRGRLVDVPHLLPGEAEHLERLVGELQVLVVVDGLDLGLALGQSEDSVSCRIDQSEGSIHLGDVVVVVDVVAEETLLLELGHGWLHLPVFRNCYFLFILRNSVTFLPEDSFGH